MASAILTDELGRLTRTGTPRVVRLVAWAVTPLDSLTSVDPSTAQSRPHAEAARRPSSGTPTGAAP
jgi:hypothetical protein